MSGWLAHLVIVPIVLPLATGGLLLLVQEGRHALKGAIAAVSTLAVLGSGVALMQLAAGETLVYRLGDWPSRFGIVLVADRLSAVMLVLAGVLALASLLYSLARWHRAGPRFHAVVQFLLMGLNGAFLTGDLFNLFVFFELLLAASYGLALHGSGTARVRESLHYISINLAASLLFLVGASLIYGVAGTLNLADLAARVPGIAGADRALLEAGAAVLIIAFLVKAAMWPLGFWLTGTYGAACAPAAALFVILTKVGVYAVMRVGIVVFGAGAGDSAGFGSGWLVAGGLATLAYGLLGVLASRELSRLAGYSLLVSSGTLLAAIGLGRPEVTAAALFYLVASTLGASALYLLIELVERVREPGADVLALTAEEFGEDEADVAMPEEIGIAIPATMAVLGLAFTCCALLLAGLPPLPGFIGKFGVIASLLEADAVPASAWVLFALLLGSGLAAVIGMGRAGVRIFWASGDGAVPRVRVTEMTPVVLLLVLAGALTLHAGEAMSYLSQAAQALHAPRGYIEAVMGVPR